MLIKGTVLENCPFCGRQAIAKNPQGVPVCVSHKGAYLEMKCHCGSWLEVMNGKYGTYCNCLRCGNMALKKALELNDVMKPMPTSTANIPKDKPKNIVIRSDDPEYFS